MPDGVTHRSFRLHGGVGLQGGDCFLQRVNELVHESACAMKRGDHEMHTEKRSNCFFSFFSRMPISTRRETFSVTFSGGNVTHKSYHESFFIHSNRPTYFHRH